MSAGPASAAGLRVLHAGAGTTIQDLGRRGFRRWGIPVSGALDGVSLRLVNHLVGNPEDAAVIEISGGPLRLAVDADALEIAFASFDGPLTIDGHRPRDVAPWRSTWVQRGEHLRCGAPRRSACAYLAISGGVLSVPVLGSRSTYQRARLGGLDGAALAPGDVVPVLDGMPPSRIARSLGTAPDLDRSPIRVLPGPHVAQLGPGAFEAFLAGTYCVSPAADRMGLRLVGAQLDPAGRLDILSVPTVPGVVQLPPDGDPIVLLADCQTTGGYPVVAVVCSADLARVGRLRPGADVSFAPIELGAARTAARELVATLRALVDGSRVSAEHLPDVAALADANLVGGVVDASIVQHFGRRSERTPCATSDDPPRMPS